MGIYALKACVCDYDLRTSSPAHFCHVRFGIWPRNTNRFHMLAFNRVYTELRVNKKKNCFKSLFWD